MDLQHSPPSAISPQQTSVLEPDHLSQDNGSDGHRTVPYAKGREPRDRCPSPNLLSRTRGSHSGTKAVHCGMVLMEGATSCWLSVPLLNGVQIEEGMERSAREGDHLVRADKESVSGQPECSSWYDEGGQWREAVGAGEGGETRRGLARVLVCGAGQRLVRWQRNVPWSSVFNPPTLSAFGGIAVGCMPRVRGGNPFIHIKL